MSNNLTGIEIKTLGKQAWRLHQTPQAVEELLSEWAYLNTQGRPTEITRLAAKLVDGPQAYAAVKRIIKVACGEYPIGIR